MLPKTLAITLFATSLLAAEPEKLTKLRSGYESAMTRATAPIQKTYATELEKLKTEFTKAGNLEGALAVDAELKSLLPKTSDPQQPGTDASEPGSSKAKLKALLPGIRIDGDGTWAYGKFPVVFTESEAVLQPDSKKYMQKGTYEVTGPRKVHLIFPAAAGQPMKIFDIEFSRDMKTFTSNAPDLKGAVSTAAPK